MSVVSVRCRVNPGHESYLLAVAGGGLAELARVPHDLVILGVDSLEAGALALAGGVGGGAEVLQTGLAGEDVEPGLAVVGRGQAERGQEKERRGEHLGWRGGLASD